MAYFWITFGDTSKGSVEADNMTEAENIAVRKTGKIVARCQSIPYGSSPIIHKKSNVPSFCDSPLRCAGSTSCYRNPSCSE